MINIQEMETLLDLAEKQNSIGNYDEAVQIANEILDITRVQANDLVHKDTLAPYFFEDQGKGKMLSVICIKTLLCLANSYRQRGNYDEALLLSENAFTISDSITLQEFKVKSWTMIGNIYNSLGERNNALDYYLRSLAHYEEINDNSGIALAFGNIGVVYYHLGIYDKALEYYTNALAIHEELQEKSLIGRVASNLGILHCFLGYFDKSLEYYTKALTIHKELNEKTLIARTTGNIGIVYYHLSSFEKSLEFYIRALSLHEELGEESSIARVTGNIAIVYAALSNFDCALEYFSRSLLLHEKFGELSSIAKVRGNIGCLYADFKMHTHALDCFTKAFAEYNDVSDKLGVAIITQNLGALYADNSYSGYNTTQAEQYQVDALAKFEEIGSKQNLIQTHQHLANLYKQQNRWEEYSKHIEKYHELYTEVQNEEVKKQADRFGWERKIADMEKQKEIEAIKTDADKRILEETISFQKQSLEQQAREVKNTVDELVRKNSLLQLIQSDLKKIAPHTKREGTDYIDQLLERVTRNITPLESNQQLDKQLTEVHGDFIRNLHEKFPDLTAMELKIAALLSMKLTSSNIAAALFLAKRTVESHRFSLRKKMGLGTSDDIYQALAKYMVL